MCMHGVPIDLCDMAIVEGIFDHRFSVHWNREYPLLDGFHLLQLVGLKLSCDPCHMVIKLWRILPQVHPHHAA